MLVFCMVNFVAFGIVGVLGMLGEVISLSVLLLEVERMRAVLVVAAAFSSTLKAGP
jgi:hypothetical protein